jgi:Domain of unknown function (DUF397)
MVNIMNWRKSSYSGSNSGNCVEVADDGSSVMVRDTKQNGRGPMLTVSPSAWQTFVEKLRNASLASGSRT